LNAAKKVLERLLEAFDEAMEDSWSTRSTRQCLQKYSTPTWLDYEELEGLSDPGQRDCSQAWNILEQGIAHGMYLTSLWLLVQQ
jgi:hypothetical protein